MDEEIFDEAADDARTGSEVVVEEVATQYDTERADEDQNDRYASIRAHFEAGVPLTDEETDAVADVAVGYLRGILKLFGEEGCSIDEYDGDDGELILDVNGGDLAVLIGRHGSTLDALQLLVSSLVSAKLRFHYPVVVDIEGYKGRRKEKVQSLARRAASKARREGGRVSLPPMNAYERRIVHLTLVGDDDVTTHSEGEEPNRRVIVTAVRK